MTKPPSSNEYLVVGGKIYSTCDDCGKLVRVNKPLFGSLHVCIEDEDEEKAE